ncbi:MAG: NAD-dependent epimerase/dehydratase family protein [Chloroflexi bacterium]|nr:NAD-dependent epimerase/dehydratase family protein [Chloroflexota bacterium]
MKCVIMGGGGFIGSHLSETLLADGHGVTIFDRPEARYMEYSRQKGARVITGDFFNPGDLSQAILDCDVVYHLVSATVPQTSNDNPQYDVEANVIGTLRLLDELGKARIQKIIYASSGGTVYGIPQAIPIQEDHPTEPTSSYGICKLTIEKYLHLYSTIYGLDYRILRIANAYGERQPVTETQGVISAFLDKALRGNEIIVWGDGSIMRDYIYVGDIAKAFLRVAMYKGEEKIYNIGSGQGHSLNDIIGAIENIVQRPLQVKYLLGRPFDVPVNVLDISRAKMCLNWKPTIGLFEGISRSYEWLQKKQGI